MDVVLLVFLLLLNALFAMSEMALSASRKARLQLMVESGHHGAVAAIELHDHPTKFLSTVQIGITGISVLNGIVGDAAFSEPFGEFLRHHLPMSERVAHVSATAMVVLVITVITIIFGELVPKRVGQMYPETVASLVARPMQWVSAFTRPLVILLSVSTEAVIKLLGVRVVGARPVTEEEIAASLEEGLDAGVIEAQEHQMVRNVFRLDDRQAGSMMIPRAEIAWLDAGAPISVVLQALQEQGHARYPVCRGSLDDVIGVVTAKNLLKPLAEGRQPVLAEHLDPPVFVPETITGMELLDHFRANAAQLVFVVDEYGAVQGVITLRDVLEAITGEFNDAAGGEEPWAVQREDGSWLMDGLIPVPELKDRLDIKELPEEDRGRYNTLAGMVMLLLGRLPRTTDVVEWGDWRFEVVDLDGKRVDKVLVTRHLSPGDNE
jgi:putative hemolysin